ncbi:recombinase family protein [Carnobacterium jeotgali]|uniref:recombinase family protein n=2 Tax=Carnobacterium jeotgali TaxID=545534 RepID=UPI000555E039|nr:recombinase family protein [Carnobacterium jeotgali]
MVTAIYVRVSTEEQAKEGYSVGEQTERMKAYCDAKGWKNIKVYTDAGLSGSNMNRPALQKMLTDIDRKEVNRVVVYKLDRLSRSQKNTLFLIEDVFMKNNIDFVDITENLDSSTPIGRMMIGVMSAFSQLEREWIKERMAMGHEARAKAGLYHGGGPAPIGYDYEDGLLVIDPYEAMQIRYLYEEYAKGTSLRELKRLMNEKYKTKHGAWTSDSSIRRSLSQKLYVGKIDFKEDTYDGLHEPIVSKELFDEVQSKLLERSWGKRHAGKSRPFTAKSLLTGLLYCGHCGARYFGRSQLYVYKDKREPRHYYTCYSRCGHPAHMVKDPTCKNRNYPVKKLDAKILNEIKVLSLNLDSLDNMVTHQNKTSQKSILASQLSKLDKQISKLLDLLQNDKMPFEAVSKRLETLNSDRKTILDEIDNLEEEPKLAISEAKRLITSVDESFDNLELVQKRKIIHNLINKITITGDDITIQWSFV